MMKFTNYDFQQIGSWSIKIKIAVVFVGNLFLMMEIEWDLIGLEHKVLILINL